MREVQLLDGRRVDVACAGPLISEIGAHLDLTAPVEIDCGGGLATRPFTEPHLHLDKAGTADRLPAGASTIGDAIAAMQSVKVTERDNVAAVAARMHRVLNRIVDDGSHAIRALVDVDEVWGLTAFHAAQQVQAALAPRAVVQIVAFPQHGLTPQVLAMLEQAAAEGAGALGAHTDVDPDPAAHVGAVAAIAAGASLPLEVHTDEGASPDKFYLPAVLEVLDRFPGLSTTLAHCLSLGTIAPKQQQHWIEELAHRDIKVCVAPSILGFGLPLAPVRALIEAGVGILVGSDNLQDVFFPLGTGRAIENVRLLATAAQLTAPELAGPLIAGVTDIAYATVTGAADALAVESPATLVVHDATSPAELLRGIDGTRITVIDGLLTSPLQLDKGIK
uniref:Putative ammelide aminohydrolase n=1 Tax=Rhodococcus sp. Mel TaxID=1093626 RepID=H8ZKS7_9NOCA|nr:putative ammelide aminohydrolase [Rhodococcus sp. Mel]